MKIDRTDIFYIDSYFQTIPMKPMQRTESFLPDFFVFFHIQQKHSVHYPDLPREHQKVRWHNPSLIWFLNQSKNVRWLWHHLIKRYCCDTNYYWLRAGI